MPRASLALVAPLLLTFQMASAESFERMLLAAAQSGDLPLLQTALMSGARADYQEVSTGDIALLRAIRERKPEIVALLLKFGANPNITNKKGESPLPMAVDDPDTRIAKMLLRGGAYVPNLQIEGRNILLYAVQKGRFELARMMIENGHGDMRLRDENGNNLAGVAILFAAEFPYKEAETAEFIDWLRQRGLSFAETNNLQQSLIELAIASGRKPVALAVDWNRQHPATIAAMKTLSPEERLELAVQKNDFETVRAQLKTANVAAVEAKLNVSLTCLAIESNQLDLLELLAKHRADFQRPGTEGLTPLALALAKDNRQAAVILVNNGARADLFDKAGACPLFMACASGSLYYVKLFAQAGANLAIKNRAGLTALMCSVHSGEIDLAKFLIAQGIDPAATNNKGQTAADIAASVGEIGMVRLLDKSGKHAELLAEFTPMKDAIHIGTWETAGDLAGQLRIEFADDGTGTFVASGTQGRIVWKGRPDFSAELYVKQPGQMFQMVVTYDFATTELILDNGGQQVRLRKSTQAAAASSEANSTMPTLRVKEKIQGKEDRSGDALATIPEDLLASAGEVRELDLSYNRLVSLDGIKTFKALQKLNLRNNRLSFLPDDLGELSRLQNLDLSDNRLTLLPDRMGLLTLLKTLDLSHNGLQSIPSTLWKLNALESLDLSSNHLTEIPAVIPELTGLRTLSVANNGLYEVPARLRNLTRLAELDLSFNRITELPDEFARMTNLKLVRLAGNPLDEEKRKRLRLNFPRLAFQFEEESIAPPRRSPPPFVFQGKQGIPPALPVESINPKKEEEPADTSPRR